MSVIDQESKEINCKIVYYGPGRSGKSSNIKYIYSNINVKAKGKLISLATETEKTMFFDFLPLQLGEIGGFKTRFHLYTVPGQIFYNASRKLILRGADGVVFVADAQEDRLDANIESLENLIINMQEMGKDLKTFPLVIQYNKRDMPNALPIEELRKFINPYGAQEIEAVALKGDGIFETLKNISKLILVELTKTTNVGKM
jgi:signal recognition particle receptor subunit beta